MCLACTSAVSRFSGAMYRYVTLAVIATWRIFRYIRAKTSEIVRPARSSAVSYLLSLGVGCPVWPSAVTRPGKFVRYAFSQAAPG